MTQTKLTQDERLSIAASRIPDLDSSSIVTVSHSSQCHNLFGGRCNCVVDLVLEHHGKTLRIDALGNLTPVSTH